MRKTRNLPLSCSWSSRSLAVHTHKGVHRGMRVHVLKGGFLCTDYQVELTLQRRADIKQVTLLKMMLERRDSELGGHGE